MGGGEEKEARNQKEKTEGQRNHPGGSYVCVRVSVSLKERQTMTFAKFTNPCFSITPAPALSP